MKNIFFIKRVIVFIVVLMLISCTTIPPSPKKPRESNRISINKKLPVEIDGATK